MANEVEITIRGDDHSDAAFNSVIASEKKLEKQTKDVGTASEAAGKKIKEAFKEVGQKAKDAGEKADDAGGKIKGALGDTASDAASGLMGKLGPVGDLLGKLGPVGMAAGAAIGVALGAAALGAKKLKEALDEAIRRQASTAKLGAQLGLDPEQMRQYGKVAGQVYADNFGESIDDINTTIKSVVQNMRGIADTSADSVRQMTEQISTLMATTGEDADALTRAASQMIRTGLAGNATQAFDLISKGAQIGADKAHDLLDTFNEYGTQFRKLGIDGPQALGLISQAIKAGARDSDVAADALKEFAIRAVDGSKLTSQGFKALGLDAKKMASDIASGGPKANAALDTTLDRLRAIKDPAERAKVAVALFGTQAEDLGDALYAMNLDTATAQLGDFEGATQKAADTLGGTLQSRIDSVKRKFENWKASIGEELIPVVNYLADNVLPKIQAAMQIVGEKFEYVWNKAGPGLINMLNQLKQLWVENQDSIEKLKPVLEYLGVALGVTLVAALVIIGGLIGGFIIWLGKAGDATADLKGAIDHMVVALLEAFDMILTGAAAAFGWIPGIGPKLKSAQKSFHTWSQNVINDIKNANAVASSGINVRIRVGGLNSLREAINGVIRLNRMAGASEGIGVAAHATGGIAGGLTTVAERGGELMKLPQGTMVYSNANTNQMLAQSNSAGGTLKIEFDTTGASDELKQWLQKAFRFKWVTVPASAVS
jgi:TP901 family phage tail tape measure protein